MTPLLLAGIASVTPLALAASPPAKPTTQAVNPFEEPDESELFRLDEQLVTVASRYAQTLRKAPSIVTLITAEQVRQRGYRTLSDVLRDLPGIYVWKTPEGRDIASFRGVVSADNNKILLLIDGIPWYDGIYTHSPIDDYLPLSNVKQIEVVKGPSSIVYGTNAFTGAVNVVTWSGAELDGARVRAVAGGLGMREVTASVGGRETVAGLPVDAKAYVRVMSDRGDGVDITPRNEADINGHDPKQGLNVGGRIEVEGLALQVHHVDYAHAYLSNAADAPPDLANKDLDEVGLYYHNTAFDMRYRWSPALDVEIVPYLQSQRHDNYGSYFFETGYRTTPVDPEDPTAGYETRLGVVVRETEKDSRRWSTGVNYGLRAGLKHVNTGGLGMEQVHVREMVDRQFTDGSTAGESTGFEAPSGARLTNLFAFTQHTFTATPGLELVGGARLDWRLAPTGVPEGAEVQPLPPVVSPRVGVLWIPADTVTTKLLYGSAFRAPNVRELIVVSPLDEETGTFEFASGNYAVQPERIHTVEAEVTARPFDEIEGRASVQYSKVLQEIDKLPPRIEYLNLAGALNIVGAEAQVTATAKPATFSATYALTLARYDDAADPYAGRRQYEFPPHMFKGSIAVDLSPDLSAWFGSELYTVRPRQDWSPDANLPDGEPFALTHVGVRAARLGKEDRYEMNVSVRNLTDARWGTGVYRDIANQESRSEPGTPRFPVQYEGTERAVYVALEGRL